ncbi:MAG: dihydroorotase [Gammaproteobacteria bacterium]|nr:dihydroorotase [Gammaproteobacteria bacterium]
MTAATPTLSLTRPDDWHLHLRDGPTLAAVAPDTARRFGRAIVMPNLLPPVTTTAQALAYRERVLAAVPAGLSFEPLMALYLTDETTPAEILRARASGAVAAVKLYPAGATTHSDAGVTDLTRTHGALAAMAETGLPLLIHGEVTDPQVDIFDRERVFLERSLFPLIERFPGLKVVLEHVSTREGVARVRGGPERLAATITPHHLLLSRNAMFAGGLRPHHFCLPVAKREEDRLALVEAATSGHPRFFLGTDSAPHPRRRKESGSAPGGIYTAHAAIELYAEVFEQAGALERLEAFASFHGPDFYGLPRNRDRVTLVREPWTVPATLAMGEEELVPFRAGEGVAWRLAG